MIFVIVITWLRFLCYLLVIRATSKLILTLIKMMADTANFILINAFILLINATIFYTLFQDTDQKYFGTFSRSWRTLFDALFGVFGYAD